MKCPLCGFTSTSFFKEPGSEYNRCDECRGVFLLPRYHLSDNDEKRRYEKHNNDVLDPRYQGFVQPLVEEVMRTFPRESRILDFGCGNGPVISHMLKEEGYRTDLYDPYFHNDESIFSNRYDAIILSEVMEHFNHPGEEFQKLFPLLSSDGRMFCLTELYDDDIDFNTWHYKDDETHVFFYCERSIEYLVSRFERPGHSITGRLLIL